MTCKPIIAAAALAALLVPGAVVAHHSFAVFFNPDKVVRIKGTVKSFRFANPHGTIVVGVPAQAGGARDWQIETSSPSVLSRRGWARDSLRAGEQVTVEGWLARDGSRYLRLRQAYRADGKPVSSAAFSEVDD